MGTYDASTIMTPASREGFIGRGGFGTVRVCKLPSQEIAAAKCIATASNTENKNEKFPNEATVLLHIQHKNILKVYGITKWSGAMAILTEYLSVGSLDSLLHNRKVENIPWALRLRIACELSEALVYIHNYKQNKLYVHGDVKPENVLLDDSLAVKLADFGSVNLIRFTNASDPSISLTPNTQHTAYYTAPEFLKTPNLQRVPSMDIYSYSMVVYELITRTRVYSNASVHPGVLLRVIIDKAQRPDQKEFKGIRKKLSKRKTEIFDTMSKLMESCWNHHPDSRPTANQVCDILLEKLKKPHPTSINKQAASVAKVVNTSKPQFDQRVWITLDTFSYPFVEVDCSDAEDFEPTIESELTQEEIESLINEKSCLRLREFSKKYGHPTGVKKAERMMLKQFDLFVEKGEFNVLPFDDMVHIIKSKQNEMLPSAESIFHAVIAWVKYNHPARGKYFCKLFKLVDSNTLSKEFLRGVVLNEDLVMNCQECLKSVTFSMMPRVDSALNLFESAALLVIRGDSTVLKYDARSRQLTRMPRTGINHYKGSAVSINHRVFVIGGKCTKAVEMLDLTDPSPHWVELSPTNEHRWYAASTTHAGYIYTAGGIGSFSSVERYNCKSNQWVSFSPQNMNKLRHGHAMVTMEGKLYVLGGGIGTERFRSVECFSPSHDHWCTLSPMNIARQWLAAVELNNEIYAIGGWNSGYLTSVEKYDPRSDRWLEVAGLNKARFGHGACVLGGRIYVIGGEGKCTVEVYDPSRDMWEIETSSPDLYDVDCIVPT